MLEKERQAHGNQIKREFMLLAEFKGSVSEKVEDIALVNSSACLSNILGTIFYQEKQDLEKYQNAILRKG